MRDRISLQKGLVALAILASLLGTIGLSPRAEAGIALDIINGNHALDVLGRIVG